MRRVTQKCVGVTHQAGAAKRPLGGAALPLRGRRRHRFPRSHGPTEHKVKAMWLRLPCRVNPIPSSAASIASSRRKPIPAAMPKEPESRRNPGKSAIMHRRIRRLGHPSGSPRGPKASGLRELHARAQRAKVEMSKEPECRKNPSPQSSCRAGKKCQELFSPDGQRFVAAGTRVSHITAFLEPGPDARGTPQSLM